MYLTLSIEFGYFVCLLFFLLMIRRPPRSTRTDTSFPTRRSSDLEPDALLLVMPSDHVIGDVEAFHRAVRQALPVAAEGWLVTFGIRPEGPPTGYGYIEIGEELAPGVKRAVRLCQKHDRRHQGAVSRQTYGTGKRGGGKEEPR